MNKCTRCLLSAVLAVCLVLSLFTGAFAAPSATLIVTTPSGYTSASEVNYKTSEEGYIINWGARGEDCGFLTTYAQNFYTGSYQYSSLSKVSGGTSTSNAPSSSLYSSLQTLMVDNHINFTKYGSSSGLQCKYLYQYTDCMLGDPTYVSTLYRGLKVSGDWDDGAYNQEHVWPQSKCLGSASTSDIGDIMQLRAANSSENSSRGNTAYGESAGYYDPGVSVRGDCARTVLYMYVRWGNTENMWGTEGVMESLDVLLRWNLEDPVDTWEMGHNDAVQSITGTRNVFVDYPEYAYLLFGRSIPTNLTTPATGGNPNANNGGESGGTVPNGAIASLVTDASSLKAGDQIIIAALDYDVALSVTQTTNNRSEVPILKDGATVIYNPNVQILTLVNGSSSGTFALQAGTGAYLTAASSTANNLKTKNLIDANSSWTLGVDANTGAAFVTANGTYTRNVLRYNSSSNLFSCYAVSNNQKDIGIYRLTGEVSEDSGGTDDTTENNKAVLVTSTSSLKVGDRIVIASYEHEAALGTTQNANNRSQGFASKSGNVLTFDPDVQILTLESGSVSGTFALQADTGKYLYAPSSSSNHLKTTNSVTDNGSWNITIDSSTGIATVIAAGTSTRNVLRYNVGSSLFSCYAENNKQLDLSIYRIEETGECNHSYTSRVTTYATCTKDGVRTYTCALCSNSYTVTIPAEGHSYGAVVTAPTCTAQGYTTYTCSSCGDSYTGNTTAATGHNYVSGKCTACGAAAPSCSHSYTSKVTTAATCTTSGIRTYTCTKCGDSYTQTIAATNHNYGTSVTAPTCSAQGYTTYTCTKCGDSYTGNTTAATGHNYVSGSCTSCGSVDPNYSAVKTYYLFGFINGADYACEGDYENMGQYKFVNGTLIATFTQDSYVGIKTEGNTAWYMTDGWQGMEATAATFYETGKLANPDKLYVPGNVQVTFTLNENPDGSLDLSYTTGSVSASVVPTLTLKAPTLEFKDMITVNAFYTAENTQDVVEMGMITYSYKAATANVATAENIIPGATYEAGSGRYYSCSQGIHAKYLGDTVYLAIYAKLSDGTYAYSKVAGYSAVQYATSQLKGTDTKLKQLVAAMLNYGAEAQLYFGHNTGSLANASLTADQLALPESYRADMVSSVPTASASKQGSFANNQGFASKKPAISFEGAFCINYFFTPNYAPTNGITLYYWNVADYNAASVLTTANATGSIQLEGSGTGEYRGDIVGISAKNLSEAVYVAAVYQSGGTTWTSGVLGYSIGAYCGGQATKGGTVADLAMATAVYGYHAKAYFG